MEEVDKPIAGYALRAMGHCHDTKYCNKIYCTCPCLQCQKQDCFDPECECDCDRVHPYNRK